MGENGEEVTNTKIIAKEYLRGDFTVDLLSTIPLDTILSAFLPDSTAEKFKLLGLLKLIRVVRLNRIIRNLNVEKTLKVTLKLCKLMFLLTLYVHC